MGMWAEEIVITYTGWRVNNFAIFVIMKVGNHFFKIPNKNYK